MLGRFVTLRWILVLVTAFMGALGSTQGPVLVSSDKPHPIEWSDARQTYYLKLDDFLRTHHVSADAVRIFRVPASQAALFSGAGPLSVAKTFRYRVPILPAGGNQRFVNKGWGEIVYIATAKLGILSGAAALPGPFPTTYGNDPIVWNTGPNPIPSGYLYNPSFHTSSSFPGYKYFVIAQPYNGFCLDTSNVTSNVVPLIVSKPSSGIYTLTIKGGGIQFDASAQGQNYIVWIAKQDPNTPTPKVFEQFYGTNGGQGLALSFP